MRFLLFALALPLLAGPSSTSTSSAKASMDRIPAWFEANRGQWKPDVRYASRSANGTLWVTGNGARFSLPGGQSIGFRLKGANPGAPVTGISPRSATTQYFIGRDRDAWSNDVPQFTQVSQRGVYPGIDLVYYSSGKHLEYDFVVAPGADPTRIRLAFGHSGKTRIDADGNLILNAEGEEVKHLKPFVYQGSGLQRVEVAASYKIDKSGDVRFVVAPYDTAKPLVIDPVLTYAAYLGGSRTDSINGAVVDVDGSLWIAGETSSSVDIPAGATPVQSANAGQSDAFIARIATGDDGVPVLTYYAYLGGASDDLANAIALDANGYVWVAGRTNSVSFPLGGDAYQVQGAGDFDLFVAQFRPQNEGAESLFYSSYYGGTGAEYAQAIATDGQIAVVTGYTNSGELPAVSGLLQPSNRGGWDGLVVKFNPYAGTAPSTLAYATFFGGNGTDSVNAVALEKSGTVLIAGYTASNDLPLAGVAFQDYQRGRANGFLTRLDLTKPTFDALLYSTYVGGNFNDSIEGIRLEESGAVWLTGYTMSTDFYVTPEAVQSSLAGGTDAFLMRLDLSLASPLTYSTYYGGRGSDVAYAVVADPQGRPVMVGYTTSPDFPFINGFESPTPGLASDAFVAIVDPTRSGPAGRIFSTTFGGSGVDSALGAAFDPRGNLFLAGASASVNLPVTSGGAKPSYGGINSGFFVRIAP